MKQTNTEGGKYETFEMPVEYGLGEVNKFIQIRNWCFYH